MSIPRKTWWTALILCCVCAGPWTCKAADDAKRSDWQIGFTAGRSDLPAGQFVNWRTNRAFVVRADGSDCHEVGATLASQENEWTQFAGWSPDGSEAIVLRLFESPENAAWERDHRQFRMTEGWLVDCCLGKPESDRWVNVTAVDRVSIYNTGLFFVPDSDQLGFTALLNGISRPYLMKSDGTGKREAASGDGFAYGYSASPDGRLITFHENYQIVLANADGSGRRLVETGNPFNFVPQWSPDGRLLLFVSGEHYDCHPFVVRADGAGLRKLADRGGYRGVVERLQHPDFHSESSDVPVWAADGKSVFYTALVNECVELMRADLNGKVLQLTHSEAGVRHYHPVPSPDGDWLLFGSDRSGVMQLYVCETDGSDPRPISDVPRGSAAMHGHWRPRPEIASKVR
ncbi:MAG: TolB family protein [Planctomycetaceae bacterium]